MPSFFKCSPAPRAHYLLQDLFIFPVVICWRHNVLKRSTSHTTHDIRLDFVHVHITPFVFEAHDVTKRNSVFVWLAQVILPKVLQYNVLRYGESLTLAIGVFNVSHSIRPPLRRCRLGKTGISQRCRTPCGRVRRGTLVYIPRTSRTAPQRVRCCGCVRID